MTFQENNSKISAEKLQEQLDTCPTTPGVYVMRNEDAKVLYVGKAKNLRSRVRSYFQKSQDLSPKTIVLVAQIADLEFHQTQTETEAFLLENTFIKKWKPKYNIRLKDDKAYPMIRMDFSHPFPRPEVRRRQIQDGAKYYGPYPSGLAVREALNMAAQVFQLRDCSDVEFANRSRPCLSFQIGRCTAPCVGKVSKEQYAEQVKSFVDFLESLSDELLEKMDAKMEQLSEAMLFEEAAKMRDRRNLLAIHAKQSQFVVQTGKHQDFDLWSGFPETIDESTDFLLLLNLSVRNGALMGRKTFPVDLSEALVGDSLGTLLLQFYQKHAPPKEVFLSDSMGEALEALRMTFPDSHFELWNRSDQEVLGLAKIACENASTIYESQREEIFKRQQSLEKLADLLDLPAPPKHIECVDISHFQGASTVASCVVFKDGKPTKDFYRHYNIEGFDKPDDFGSLKQLMFRRFGKSETPNPDLLIVDGGKGQLQSVLMVLKELGREFPVVSLAKARTESDFQSSEVKSSEERIFKPNQKNYIALKEGPVKKLVTHLRDEAHRFAVTFHKKKREG